MLEPIASQWLCQVKDIISIRQCFPVCIS
uniref:Uncharacterized protein n=1 Tax=Arundo donax TaxID=35708 RepID=A0A0A9C2V7_ARUDO